MQSAARPAETITVAMIVRDEEAVLDRCLASFANYVDEIIIVDTGSIDQTKAIARRYTDRIFDFTWVDDFAAARQFAFDQASSTWVAWVDADDVMVGAEFLKQDIATAPEGSNSIFWRYVRGRDQWGNVTSEFWRERCVRNNGDYRWVGRIHEVLINSGEQRKIESQQVYLEHAPGKEAGPRKEGRNLKIIEQEFREAKGNVAPRLLFYMGNEYAEVKNYPAAVLAYQQYLRAGHWADELYLTHLRLANIYRIQEDYQAALDIALSALKIQPTWPHVYFDLARTYYFMKDWHKVIHWTELGRMMDPPVTVHFMNPMDWRFNWIVCWTNALYYVGSYTEAYTWTKKALEICPTDSRHLYNLNFFDKVIQQRLIASAPSDF